MVSTYRIQEKLKESDRLSARVQQAIAQKEKLTLDEFQSWIMRVKNDIEVASWLLDHPTELTSLKPTTTFYQTLAGVTHCKNFRTDKVITRMRMLIDCSGRERDSGAGKGMVAHC